MKRFQIILLALFMLPLAGRSQSGQIVADTLKQMRNAGLEISSATGTFRQHRHLDILPEPIEDKGTFYVSKDGAPKVLWVIDGKDGTRHLVRNDELTIAYPEFKEAEIYSLRDSRFETLSSLLTLSIPNDFEERFEIAFATEHRLLDRLGDASDDVKRLHLTPKDETVQKMIRSILIEVIADSGHLKSFLFEEPTGNWTVLRIETFDVGAEINEDLFELDLTGWSVTRPTEPEKK